MHNQGFLICDSCLVFSVAFSTKNSHHPLPSSTGLKTLTSPSFNECAADYWQLIAVNVDRWFVEYLAGGLDGMVAHY